MMVENNDEEAQVDAKKETATEFQEEAFGPAKTAEAAVEGGASERAFPDAFYCPITGNVMVDPVVISDGTSYERSAAADNHQHLEAKSALYPNRSLKEVIDEAKELAGSSMRAGLKRMHKSWRKSLSQMLEMTVIPSEEYRPLPDSLYCPITFGLIHVPVIDFEGNTYEKVAIENWIKKNGVSPITRSPLSVEGLYPNHAIRDLIAHEVAKPDDQVHPSIRNFKTETAPEEITLEEADASHRFPSTPEELSEQERLHRRQVLVARSVGTFILGLLMTAFLAFFFLTGGFLWLIVGLFFVILTVSSLCQARDIDQQNQS